MEREYEIDMKEIEKIEDSEWDRAWCIACHKPLDRATIAKGLCYCDDCREYAKQDDEKLRAYAEGDMSSTIGFAMLASEALKYFMKDYKKHMDSLMANPFSLRRRKMVELDEMYIHSRGFQQLSIGLVDPDRVIEWAHDDCSARAIEKREAYIKKEIKKRLKKAVKQEVEKYIAKMNKEAEKADKSERR